MEPAKTVSIVCPENLRAGYKNIPAAEFDPAIHTLFDVATGKPVPQDGVEIVEIPSEWKALHWKQRVALAEKLLGGDLPALDGQSQTEAADAVIAAEIARRAGE